MSGVINDISTLNYKTIINKNILTSSGSYHVLSLDS